MFIDNDLTAKIPKSQNALTIRDNNNLNTPFRPVLQNLKNLSPVRLLY